MIELNQDESGAPGSALLHKLSEEGDSLMFLMDVSKEGLVTKVKSLTPDVHAAFEVFAKEVREMADKLPVQVKVKVVLITT